MRTIIIVSIINLLRPVKPISLYGLFFRETYPKVKLSFPSAKFGDISREVSHRWELLCSHEKSKYKRRIEGAKREYKQDLENYKKSLIAASTGPYDPRGIAFYNNIYNILWNIYNNVFWFFTIKVHSSCNSILAMVSSEFYPKETIPNDIEAVPTLPQDLSCQDVMHDTNWVYMFFLFSKNHLTKLLDYCTSECNYFSFVRSNFWIMFSELFVAW